jgi:WD40 repeat protein
VAFSPDGKSIVSGSSDMTLKVWDSGVSALTPSNPQPIPERSCLLAAASLELKAEKQSAHSDTIWSVGFSPDGTKIVSGSDDKTLKVWDFKVWDFKVWDAGASALTPSNPQPKTYRPVLAAASLELKAEKQSAHSDVGWLSVAFSPDGKSIVSGSSDMTLKVWDAGASALTPSNP